MNLVSLRAGLLAATLALAAGLAPAQNIPGVAARVNGTEITNLRLERHFEEYAKNQRRNITTMIQPRVYKKLKREALDQLIEREVLWQAAKAEGIVAEDAEVQAVLRQMAEQMKGRDSFARKLEQAGFNEKDYAEYVRQDLSGAKFLVRKSSQEPVVGDDEVEAFYKQNIHRYTKPEAARASHILIKLGPQASAEERSAARVRIDELRSRIQAGADFSELARAHSADNSALNGGDLGEVARGRMVKAFEDALFALAPGQVSEVVATPSGLHLIKAGAVVPAVIQPLDEAKDGIRAKLLAEKRTMVARDLVARLKAAAKVETLVNLGNND
ncbi:Peptidylprolyl isomerase [Rubrivivax sp. A210]|uniref:peptidylprolyl isomerase n=1 Tax=Rubrivivax sp. A210 TaxID=2772301 RepID=UPI001918BB05|nr:peptidylprolyl isomerase [Rubrivivax sp. A210]CAD5369820.1 Peptidylprolyl isomerase [Rubrivivax sp. A210]